MQHTLLKKPAPYNFDNNFKILLKTMLIDRANFLQSQLENEQRLTDEIFGYSESKKYNMEIIRAIVFSYFNLEYEKSSEANATINDVGELSYTAELQQLMAKLDKINSTKELYHFIDWLDNRHDQFKKININSQELIKDIKNIMIPNSYINPQELTGDKDNFFSNYVGYKLLKTTIQQLGLREKTTNDLIDILEYKFDAIHYMVQIFETDAELNNIKGFTHNKKNRMNAAERIQLLDQTLDTLHALSSKTNEAMRSLFNTFNSSETECAQCFSGIVSAGFTAKNIDSLFNEGLPKLCRSLNIPLAKIIDNKKRDAIIREAIKEFLSCDYSHVQIKFPTMVSEENRKKRFRNLKFYQPAEVMQDDGEKAKLNKTKSSKSNKAKTRNQRKLNK